MQLHNKELISWDICLRLYFVKTCFHFDALYLNLCVYVVISVVSVNEEICENKSFGRENG